MAARKTSGLTKTDFMRGMQCPRMLWLDKHHPDYKIIPPHIRERLDRGNQFGDAAMGLLGPYVEVREYFPGTSLPPGQKENGGKDQGASGGEYPRHLRGRLF